MEHESEDNSNSQQNFNNEGPRFEKPQRASLLNTRHKVGCGFILGVIITLLSILVMKLASGTKFNEIFDLHKNYQTFELSTDNGKVKLHTSMSRDSVKILMGQPSTTSVNSKGSSDVHETWEYMGCNTIWAEFTIEFTNGELESVQENLEPGAFH